jgi:hypothetical protein
MLIALSGALESHFSALGNPCSVAVLPVSKRVVLSRSFHQYQSPQDRESSAAHLLNALLEAAIPCGMGD